LSTVYRTGVRITGDISRDSTGARNEQVIIPVFFVTDDRITRDITGVRVTGVRILGDNIGDMSGDSTGVCVMVRVQVIVTNMRYYR